jgi:hypothetical protein
MPLPEPTFVMTHGVLQLPNPVIRDPGRDERFLEAVRGEFPNVINHQLLPQEAPPLVPHLTVSSTSSQLAVSAAQADFEVRFYGEYVNDLERGLEYVERKLKAILLGFQAADLAPSLIGLIATLHFSFRDAEDEEPAEHILRTHLRTEVDSSDLQDAMARIALRVRDTYFVTMTLSNYESRILERPIMPGLQTIRVRPWEGRVEDKGIELGLDINNNLEARTREQDPVVTEEGIRAVTQLLRDVATTTGPTFAESGTVSVDSLTTSATP